MLYWREEWFDDLREAAASASALGWPEYAAYCLEQEKGLRRQAFAALDCFINSIQLLAVSERRKFVSWLMSFVDERPGRDLLMPHPLKKQIVEPTLIDWVVAEPNNAEPHLWLGGLSHLERALAIEPLNQRARRKLILFRLSWIDYAGHELPRGYLGSVSQDLQILDQVSALLPDLLDEKLRSAYAQEVAEQRAAIAEYLNRSKE